MKPSAVHLIIAIFCFSLFIFPIRSAQQNVQVISSQGAINGGGNLGWLHTDGRYIKDSFGNIVTLTGWTWNELGWRPDFGEYQGANFHPEQHLEPRLQRAIELGVNSIRLPLSWYNWRGIPNPANSYDYDLYVQLTGNNPPYEEYYKGVVDNVVHRLAENNIYVILDEHAAGGSADDCNAIMADPTEWINYHKEVCARYADKPNVIAYNPMNEPHLVFPTTGNYWHDLMSQVAEAIHSVNPNILVFVPNPIDWDRDLQYWFIVSQPLDEPNIVYAFHHYPHLDSPQWHKCTYFYSYMDGDYDLARQQMEQLFYDTTFKMLDYDYPIFHEEWGIHEETTYMSHELQLIVEQDMFNLMKKYGVGWNWWNWGPGNYPLTLDDWSTLCDKGEILVQNLEPLPHT